MTDVKHKRGSTGTMSSLGRSRKERQKPENAENKTAFPFTAVLTFEDALGEHGGWSNMPLIYGPPLCWDLFPRYSFFILKTLRERIQNVALTNGTAASALKLNSLWSIIIVTILNL